MKAPIAQWTRAVLSEALVAGSNPARGLSYPVSNLTGRVRQWLLSTQERVRIACKIDFLGKRSTHAMLLEARFPQT